MGITGALVGGESDDTHDVESDSCVPAIDEQEHSVSTPWELRALPRRHVHALAHHHQKCSVAICPSASPVRAFSE